MRDIDSQILAILASREDIEPVNYISINWGGNQGTGTVYYDRKVDEKPGRIIEMSAFTDSQRSDSSGSSGSVSVTLSDLDGDLKGILDGNDIHKKPAYVYQGFLKDGELLTGFLVHAGQISTPIEWSEGNRTLKFDIVTKLEDNQVGYSAEMGNSDQVAQELIGVPWPMVFGTVTHSPCLQLQNIPTAFTAEPFQLIDTTLKLTITNLQNDLQNAISGTLGAAAQHLANPNDGADAFSKANAAIQDDPEYQQMVQLQADIQTQIDQLKEVQSFQSQYVRGSVPLVPTVNVTQPFNGTVRVGNNLFHATIKNTSGTLDCRPVPQPGQFAGEWLKTGPQFYNAGTQVVIADDYPIQHVASITPGTVTKVWASRNFNGITQMAVVPPDYYTISSLPAGFLSATVVTLKRPLSTTSFLDNLYTQNWENNFGQYLPPHIVNQVDWDDKIYVTFESSVGPNAVDIMEWLISNYTTNSIDTDSFDACRGKVGQYPMSFTLQDQPNVLSLLTEIAYQARCVIFLRNDKFYLIHLPTKPPAVDSITEDDVIDKSLVVTCTPTESLVTKYIATYRPDYTPFYDKPVEVILRYNIDKYGTHEESHDFYCYDNFYATEKMATFWMARKSNTFKILKCKLLITKLNLEVFDGVTLAFDKPYIAAEPVVGIITSCSYNSDDKTIDVEIWTPVRLGAMKPYDFAWPASMTEKVKWPHATDRQGGSGGGLSNTHGGGGLPPANSVRFPVGVIDGFGFLNANAIKGTNGRDAWDSGTPDIADGDGGGGGGASNEWQDWRGGTADGTADAGWQSTPTPITAPRRDYQYKPDNLTITDYTGVYAAKVVGKAEGDGNYDVEIYYKGVKGKGSKAVAQQLQIDPDDRIPDGTWTLCSVHRFHKDKDDPNSDVKIERIIQVPIWLS